MCNNFVVVFGMYIKRTILTEGEREGDGEGEHDASRGEDEHEERGADA